MDLTVCNFACSNCALNDIVTCPDPNTWGLTFNEGPSESTAEQLNVLKENNLKASFFLVGGSVVKHQDVVKRQANEGHHLASLT
ncbi:chitin deacetylase, partial [Linnemannia gamsii]